MKERKEQHLADNAANQDPRELTRREALQKMGAYAAYTSPVVITLMTSRRATAQSVIVGPPVPPVGPPGP